MLEQERNEDGKFAAKGSAIREVRSIRLTTATWESLGEKADEHDLTKADYLEALFSGEIEWESDNDRPEETDLDFDPDEVAEILKEALTLKANAGGKIKTKIKEALQLMSFDPSEDQSTEYYAAEAAEYQRFDNLSE